MISQISLNFFGEATNHWANFHLEPRLSLFGSYSFYFLILSLLLIVLAKYANSKSFEAVLILFFRPRKTDTRIKEVWPIFASSSWFLTANFIVTFAHSLFMVLQEQAALDEIYLILIAFVASIAFFLLAFLSLFFIVLLTGYTKIYQAPMQLALTLPQFVGLLFFLFNLIWVLNPDFGGFILTLLVGLFILLSFQRIIRSSVFLLNVGVEWYYILLYLCTLEILPLSILAWFLFNWIV